MKCPTSTRLVSDLHDKTHVRLHISYLKCLVQVGAVVSKLHRVVKFAQTPWLKPYIEANTKCRREAKDNFAKQYYKLCINSQYGEFHFINLSKKQLMK